METKYIDSYREQTNTDIRMLNLLTSLTYCMMDVLHTMLMDCEKYMKVCGKGLCREEKRKWNEFIRAQQRLKFCAKQITHVCYKDLPENVAESYASDSDFICDLIYLVIDKCGEDEDTMTKVRSLIFNSFKSKVILPDGSSFYQKVQ